MLIATPVMYVPRAEQFFILGEVQKPSMYKLEPNLTVIQAISLAGGVTPRGSDRGNVAAREMYEAGVSGSRIRPWPVTSGFRPRVRSR